MAISFNIGGKHAQRKRYRRTWLGFGNEGLRPHALLPAGRGVQGKESLELRKTTSLSRLLAKAGATKRARCETRITLVYRGLRHSRSVRRKDAARQSKRIAASVCLGLMSYGLRQGISIQAHG